MQKGQFVYIAMRGEGANYFREVAFGINDVGESNAALATIAQFLPLFDFFRKGRLCILKRIHPGIPSAINGMSMDRVPLCYTLFYSIVLCMEE